MLSSNRRQNPCMLKLCSMAELQVGDASQPTRHMRRGGLECPSIYNPSCDEFIRQRIYDSSYERLHSTASRSVSADDLAPAVRHMWARVTQLMQPQLLAMLRIEAAHSKKAHRRSWVATKTLSPARLQAVGATQLTQPQLLAIVRIRAAHALLPLNMPEAENGNSIVSVNGPQAIGATQLMQPQLLAILRIRAAYINNALVLARRRPALIDRLQVS